MDANKYITIQDSEPHPFMTSVLGGNQHYRTLVISTA